MKKLHKSPIPAIREYCLSVCSLTPKEVRLCTCVDCPLYAFRMGIRPSEETLKTLKDYFSKNPKPSEDS